MYVCMYIGVRTYEGMPVGRYTRKYIWTRASMCICISVSIYICMCIYMFGAERNKHDLEQDYIRFCGIQAKTVWLRDSGKGRQGNSRSTIERACEL